MSPSTMQYPFGCWTFELKLRFLICKQLLLFDCILLSGQCNLAEAIPLSYTHEICITHNTLSLVKFTHFPQCRRMHHTIKEFNVGHGAKSVIKGASPTFVLILGGGGSSTINMDWIGIGIGDRLSLIRGRSTIDMERIDSQHFTICLNCQSLIIDPGGPKNYAAPLSPCKTRGYN